MSNHTVSALKYRPKTFDEVVGQHSITQTLRNAIANEKVAHAYLFCGPRGVGKTTCARIFAKELNKKFVSSDQEMTFNIFELDAASNNSVEDIRQLIDQVRVQPPVGRYKVYIIDEVHMLSQSAFNAFLKTLEEPPPHAIFILATTEKHKVLPTILSRCQVYDFGRISVEDITKHLAEVAGIEGVAYEQEALYVIAQKAEGGLRDALSIFDQIVNFSEGEVSYDRVIENLHMLDLDVYLKVTDFIISGDLSAALIKFHEILKRGFDGHHFINGLSEHFRNLMVIGDQDSSVLAEIAPEKKDVVLEQAQKIDSQFILKSLNLLNEADQKYNISKNQNLLVEILLMNLCNLSGLKEQKKTDRSNTEIKSSVAFDKTEQSNSPKNSTIEVQELEKISVKYENIDQVKTESAKPQELEIENSSEQDSSESDTSTIEVSPTETITTEKKIIRSSDSISLKKFGEVKQESQAKEESPLKEEQDAGKPFNLYQLMEVWNEYAEKVKNQKKFSFHSTLSNRDPELINETTIKLVVENEVQMQDLQDEKMDLLEYLRDRLSNQNIHLISEVSEAEDDSVKFLTPREKYMAMLKKNPVLGKLSEQLDLDLE